MTANRTARHDRLFSVAKKFTASPLFPWVNLVAHINLAMIFLGLYSDRTFALAELPWHLWLGASIFLMNAFLIALELVRPKRRR